MKIALITEGASENRIIKHIISKYFKGSDPEIEINQIQPKLLNDKQETPGGWSEVLKYCERDELRDIFIENKYLVIQIDTDQSQTAPFNVSHTDKNNELKSIEKLCSDIRERLVKAIKLDIWNEFKDRIFFAICVSEIECWLLPIYDKSDFLNCIKKLNKELAKRNIRPIPENDKNSAQSIKSYSEVLKNLRKREDIVEVAQNDESLRIFINSLDFIDKALAADKDSSAE